MWRSIQTSCFETLPRNDWKNWPATDRVIAVSFRRPRYDRGGWHKCRMLAPAGPAMTAGIPACRDASGLFCSSRSPFDDLWVRRAAAPGNWTVNLLYTQSTWTDCRCQYSPIIHNSQCLTCPVDRGNLDPNDRLCDLVQREKTHPGRFPVDVYRRHNKGWVPEWLKGPVLKTGRG